MNGAAAGTTDGGLGSWSAQLTDVILKANGTIDYDHLFDFGYLAIHQMSLLGKELARQFYGTEDKVYSYYHGCSEGGREGWSQVQRYGDQFDGAAIGAPAFRQAFQQTNHLFPAVIETQVGYFPSSCELNKITNDTIAACDELDGRADGVVSRTDLCFQQINLNDSVGTAYSCEASGGGGGMRRRQMGGGSTSPAANGTVSQAAVDLYQQVLDGLHDSQGRRVYVSFQISSDLSTPVAGTYNEDTGEYEATPDSIGGPWVQQFINEVNVTSMSVDNVTVDDLRGWILESMQKFQDTMQTTWPDLEDFKDAGGKVIHYHGESDNSIPAASSIRYHEAVRSIMYPDLSYDESTTELQEWYKFFLVPGAGHCGSSSLQSNGPYPQDILKTLIAWVEDGTDFERLNATVIDGTVEDKNQELCAWPTRPMWSNNGTTMDCVFSQDAIDAMTFDLDSIPVPVY
jgi:tannase